MEVRERGDFGRDRAAMRGKYLNICVFSQYIQISILLYTNGLCLLLLASTDVRMSGNVLRSSAIVKDDDYDYYRVVSNSAGLRKS